LCSNVNDVTIAAVLTEEMERLLASAAGMLVRTDHRLPTYGFIAGRLAGIAESVGALTGEDPVLIAKRAEAAARLVARSA
jgi:hypothetical protein